jgi:hypothetical protein
LSRGVDFAHGTPPYIEASLFLFLKSKRAYFFIMIGHRERDKREIIDTELAAVFGIRGGGAAADEAARGGVAYSGLEMILKGRSI